MDINILKAVQSIYSEGFLGKITDFFFASCTFMAEETFLIAVILFLYWCYDKRVGEGMLISLYLANAANALIKDIVCRPRPFMDEEYKDSIRYVKMSGLVNTEQLSESFSFPSGHSQNIGVIMTSLCLTLKAKYGHDVKGVIIASFIIIPLVMVSRVYLGVHFPTDVLCGAALGILCAFVMLWLFYKFYDKRFILFAVVYIISLSALFFEPTADTLKTMGTGLGGLSGMLIESKYVKFTTDINTKKKVIRIVLGFALVMAVRLGLKAAFPSDIWFGFLRYAIIGITATVVCPVIFKRFNI